MFLKLVEELIEAGREEKFPIYYADLPWKWDGQMWTKLEGTDYGSIEDPVEVVVEEAFKDLVACQLG